jgi:hypothetical protein
MAVLSLLPNKLLREGRILEFDPGVCGVNPHWVIEYKGQKYLLMKKIVSSCPQYPAGSFKTEFYEIYIKEGDQWVPFE